MKEDPQAKGLLYAATELRVYVSFNDGDQWQPLQNNMPVTSVRDIVVHGDDLAIATYGRGFWVMDQMARCGRLPRKALRLFPRDAYLFKPGETYAIRAGGMNGTPLPHEEPQLQNPPSGVVAYYWLKTPTAQPLKIELLDASGAVRACAASDTPVRPVDTETLNVQAIWQQPARRLQPRPECIALLWAERWDADLVSQDAPALLLRSKMPARPRPRSRILLLEGVAALRDSGPVSTPCGSPWTARPTRSRS